MNKRTLPPISLIVVCALILSFSLLYLLTIGHFGFWLDEVWAIQDIQNSFIGMVQARANVGHGPVYFSIAWLWYRVVGDTEWLMRMPSLLAWLGTIIISYLMIRKRLAPWIAVLVLFLLLLNPALTYFAQLIRPYSLSVLLVLVSMYWMLHVENDPRLRDSLILAVLSALAINTNYSTAIPMLGQMIYLLVRRHPNWTLSGGIGFGMLAVIPILWYLIEHKSVTAPISWLQDSGFIALYKLPAALAIGRISTLPGYPTLPDYWPVVSVILSSLAIWGGIRSGRLAHLMLIVWLCAISVVAVFALVNGPTIGSLSRYFGVIVVAQIILIGFALDKFRQMAFTSVVVVSSLLLTTLFSWHLYAYLISWNHADWRAALHYVQKYKQDNQQIYVLGIWQDRFPYEYYQNNYEISDPIVILDEQIPRRDIQVPRLPQVTKDTKYLWVLVSRRVRRNLSESEVKMNIAELFKLSNSFKNRHIRLVEDPIVGRINILKYSLQPNYE